MSEERQFSIETLAVHAGQELDPTTLSRAVPLYQTTSYGFKDSEHAANLFALKEFGNIYTRIMNPTTDVFEKRIARSRAVPAHWRHLPGRRTITFSILNIAGAGDEIVSSSSLYGGTYNLFSNTLAKLGIKVHFVDSTDPENFRKAINDKTKAVFAETIGNPQGMCWMWKLLRPSHMRTAFRLSWITLSLARTCRVRLNTGRHRRSFCDQIHWRSRDLHRRGHCG